MKFPLLMVLGLSSAFHRLATSLDDSAILPILEEQARKLPLSQFEDDPYLLQKIDRVNSISVYFTPYTVEGKENDVVYERTQSDKDKDIVVLNRDEDKVNSKVHSDKQTYVVLVKNPKSISPAYYATYAYLRNATTEDTDTVDISGQKKIIEWDIWEDRNIKKPVLWTSCASTILLSCGFNASAFGATVSADTAKASGGAGVPSGEAPKAPKPPKVSNRTKPTVAKDDAEYQIDNYDFFDDLNIDLVHGRGVYMPGAIGDRAGSVSGGAGNMVCGVVGSLMGGTCGGGRAQKTILIQRVHIPVPVYSLPVPMPMQHAPAPAPTAYIPLGSDKYVPPLPPVMNPSKPSVIPGSFYPDDKAIPPAQGTLMPFGIGKPYLFQSPAGFRPGKVPLDRGTVGGMNLGQGQFAHGIMLPASPTSGVFVPDKMAYPSNFQPQFGGLPIHGYSIPGYPDEFVPESDVTNPLRKYDPKVPIPGTVTPDQPDLAKVGPKVGQLLNNKMPPMFIPNSLNAVKATFSDDKHMLPRITGWLIPQTPGQPDVFIPDDEDIMKNVKPSSVGTMTPANPPHGTLLAASCPGDTAHWIPDSKGGAVKFIPNNPSISQSEGTMIPLSPTQANEFFPNTSSSPPKPQLTPGTVIPFDTSKPQMKGDMIVNKPHPSLTFIPDGVGTKGTVFPADGKPPIRGVWVPGAPGQPDEFVPYDDPDGGIPPQNAQFAPDSNPSNKMPCVLGTLTHPTGNPTILNAPPRPPPDPPSPPAPPQLPPAPPQGKFTPDPPGSGPEKAVTPVNPVNVMGQPIQLTPKDPSAFPPGNNQRGVADIPGLSPQHGKAVPEMPVAFIPDPPQTISGTFIPSNPPGSKPIGGYIGPPAPPRQGEETKFTPDNSPEAPRVDTPGALQGTGQPPVYGVLHSAPYEGTPQVFSPNTPSTFTPDDKLKSPVQGSTPPVKIPNGESHEQVPYYPTNPAQVPPGSEPQRGSLQRPGSPDQTGVLLGPKPATEPAIFVPDPPNSKPAEVTKDPNPQTPSKGAAILPYNPTDPITFYPDNRAILPVGDSPGSIKIPGNNPETQHGIVKVPADPNQPVLFAPFTPCVFTPSNTPVPTPVKGSKQEPPTPGASVKFYPNNPVELTPTPTPGVLSTPAEPQKPSISGTLRPDTYHAQGYIFNPFPAGTFVPDNTKIPVRGGVGKTPGYPDKFYPEDTSGLNPPMGPNEGVLSPDPQHGTLSGPEPPPSGPRTFNPDPVGAYYPDNNPQKAIPVSIQPNPPTPVKFRPKGDILGEEIFPEGTLKSPGKPDQHGPVTTSMIPGDPYTFTPDSPGTRPVTFTPEANLGNKIPGIWADNPPSFKPSPPGLPPGQPARGTIQPTQAPGSPTQTGTLTPMGPDQPWNFTPDPPATFYPDSPNPTTPIPGNGPLPKQPQESTLFYPTSPGSMPPGNPKGTLKSPGQPDRRGTMGPNPTPTQPQSWIFIPDPPSMFIPDGQTPSQGVPGTASQPAGPGGPVPFYPNNPGQVPNGHGTLQRPEQPDKTGTMSCPGAGQPCTFTEDPPSTFYPDKNPYNPVIGAYSRSKDPAQASPFESTDPSKITPGQTPGTMNTPGQQPPDQHGYVESPGPAGKPVFHPDPPGSRQCTIYLDKDPATPVEGLLLPPAVPKGPQDFRPVDPTKLSSTYKDHGQLIPKAPPGSLPEMGTVSPGPSSPTGPFTWTPDGEGVTPAWFYPESRPQSPIRGVYYPPSPGSAEGAPAEFNPTKKAEAPTKDEHGQMAKDKPPNSPRDAGTLKPSTVPNGPNPFVPDPKGTVKATFHPDLPDKGGPMEGLYFPPSHPNTPGTFQPKVTPVTTVLPAPGQMIPEDATTPQVHGVMKEAPYPNMPLIFTPDPPPPANPEYEVGLVPLGQEAPNADMMKQNCPIGIRGMYFKNTIGQQTFVHFSGTMGSFVVNGVPPNDPKVQKVEGSYVPRRPAGPSDIGPPHHDGTLTPDPSRPGAVDASVLEQPKQQGIFYPVGATAVGISGYLMKNTANSNEQWFFSNPQPQMGTFKPIPGVGCYMYNELAQLVPYDPEYIKKKQAEAQMTPQPMKAYNFQGAANLPKYDIYVPLDGSKGKFTIANSANTIHGHFLPESGAQAAFTPDEAMVFLNLIASGPLKGTFEQDETPAVAGIFPMNGITVEVSSQGGRYVMVLTNPGRKGQLTPGRKPTPGFFIYCFGLIQNDLSAGGQGGSSTIAQSGRGKDINAEELFDPPPPPASKAGRGFGAMKPAADGRLAEHMDGRSMLSQDFGSYLQQNASVHTQTYSTSYEMHTSYSYEISAKQMEMIGQGGAAVAGAMKMMKFNSTSESKSSVGTSNTAAVLGKDGKWNETTLEESKSNSEGQHVIGNNMQQAVGGSFKVYSESSASAFMSASSGGSTPTPKGSIKGVAYKSNTGSNVFVPNTGTLGQLHFQVPTMLLNLEGTFYNSKLDPPKTSEASFIAANPTKLDGVTIPASTKGIFVPSGGQGDEGGIQVTILLPIGGPPAPSTTTTTTTPRPAPAPSSGGDGTDINAEDLGFGRAFEIPGLVLTNPNQKRLIQLNVDIPGQKGSLAMGNAAEDEAKKVNGSNAVTMLSNNGLSAASHGQMKTVPPEAVLPVEEVIGPSKGIHGTYYKLEGKQTFIPDYPGTLGTFYSRNGGPGIRGNFFPPVKGSKERFWPEPDIIFDVIPWGKELTLVGKFIPDDSSKPGEPADKANPGLAGYLAATEVPHSYLFKPDLPGQSGYVPPSSGGSGSGINAENILGRSMAKEEVMTDFVPDNQVDIALHPGWKTQYEIIVPNVTLKYDEQIFFGIGNCPHRFSLPGNLARAQSDDDILDFYMGLLRTYCISSQKKYIKQLVKEGYLEIKNKLIVVPADSKYLTMPKLTIKETERLSSAFEMCVFTLTYSDEVKKGITLQQVTTPDGKRISRSVRYLVDMSILGMKMARELCRRHSVRLSRNLITTLVTAITKLKQDIEALKGCDDCKMDRDIIHNDSIQLMGMVQFIMHGLSSVDPRAGLRDAYEAFHKGHNELIHRKVLQIQED